MDPNRVTVLLLGDQEVGKTTFLSKISMGSHQLTGRTTITPLRDIDQPFIFELRTHRGARYQLELYDTSSPESWRTLRPDMVILGFAINNRRSLLSLQRMWIKEVRKTFLTESLLPVLVLGLKRDMRSEDDPDGIIYPQEGHQVAQEMRADRYMECSAVTGELLDAAVEDICRTAMKANTPEGGQSDGACSLM